MCVPELPTCATYRYKVEIHTRGSEKKTGLPRMGEYLLEAMVRELLGIIYARRRVIMRANEETRDWKCLCVWIYGSE